MRRISRIGTCLVGMLLITACATGGLKGLLSQTLTGALTIERPSGTVTITPVRCVSGDRWNFFGADLVDASGTAGVRLAIDPIAGPRVRVTLPGGERDALIVLDASGCTTYRTDVHHNAWTVNDVRGVDGALELDCASGQGERIQGALTFRQCH